jgi:exosome complex component CSL4
MYLPHRDSSYRRLQDIRAVADPKVTVQNSFRLNDLVKTRVLTIGEYYHLSTAENELGVVQAISEAGAEMIPASWQEMLCPITNQREARKVAKPESA